MTAGLARPNEARRPGAALVVRPAGEEDKEHIQVRRDPESAPYLNVSRAMVPTTIH